MNKKIFTEPVVDVVDFDEDVIATSGDDDGDNPVEKLYGVYLYTYMNVDE